MWSRWTPVKEVNATEQLPHKVFDTVRGQPRSRASLQVHCQVLKEVHWYRYTSPSSWPGPYAQRRGRGPSPGRLASAPHGRCRPGGLCWGGCIYLIGNDDNIGETIAENVQQMCRFEYVYFSQQASASFYPGVCVCIIKVTFILPRCLSSEISLRTDIGTPSSVRAIRTCGKFTFSFRHFDHQKNRYSQY